MSLLLLKKHSREWERQAFYHCLFSQHRGHPALRDQGEQLYVGYQSIRCNWHVSGLRGFYSILEAQRKVYSWNVIAEEGGVWCRRRKRLLVTAGCVRYFIANGQWLTGSEAFASNSWSSFSSFSLFCFLLLIGCTFVSFFDLAILSDWFRALNKEKEKKKKGW